MPDNHPRGRRKTLPTPDAPTFSARLHRARTSQPRLRTKPSPDHEDSEHFAGSLTTYRRRRLESAYPARCQQGIN